MTNDQFIAEAVEQVRRVTGERIHEIQDRIERERREAIEVAGVYARLLAEDGEPTKYPEPEVQEGESRHYRSRLVSYKEALGLVWDAWNEAKGTAANPFSPIEYQGKFRVARYALAHLGEPIPYSTYGDLGGGMTKMQSGDVATVLAELQDTNGRDLLLRRVRIDGKIGYLLRERQAMEEYVGRRDEGRDRRYGVDPMAIPLESKAKVRS